MTRQQNPAAEAHAVERRAAGRHLHRAVLEFRNLAERIQHGVGEPVGGGFVVAERDKDRTARLALVGARVQRNGSAPGPVG